MIGLAIHIYVYCFLKASELQREGATVPIFKTQLRSVYPGPPIYFTEFIFGMVVALMYKIMGKWKNGD